MKKVLNVLSAYMAAPSIINRAKLKKYYIIPGFIGILLLILLIFCANKTINIVYAKISTTSAFQYLYTKLNFYDFDNFRNFAYYLTKGILWIFIAIMYFYFFQTVLLVVISPFLSYISEKTDNFITTNKFAFGIKDNLFFLKRSIKIGIICLLKQIFFTVLILILSFMIPIISPVTSVILFLIQSYFSGYAFVDYTLERYKFDIKESMKFLKRKKIYAMLIGLGYTCLLFIPIIGMFIAPFWACVAATKITLEIIKNDETCDQYVKYIDLK